MNFRLLSKANCKSFLNWYSKTRVNHLIVDNFYLEKECNNITKFRHYQNRNFTNYSKERTIFAENSIPPSSNIVQRKLVENKFYSQMSTVKNELELKEKYKPSEIKFKTPFGHVACLEWGNREASRKILCLHGWLDNANSFAKIIPSILSHHDNAKKYHIIAMDQPGCGYSSHFPISSEYATFVFVKEIRRLTQQLKWDELILLSHSFGSHVSFLYSCIYPSQTKAMISIDLAHPITRQIDNWNLTIANSIDDHFKCEYHYEDDPTTNIRVPVYSRVDAIKRLMDAHGGSLTSESAELLLERGAKKQSWGYTFARDIRLRHLSLEFRPNDDLMLQYLSEPFHPNLLIIRANQSPYRSKDEIRLKYYELFEKNCPMFRDISIDGTHHLHMNNPDLVAVEINKFLDDLHSTEPIVTLNKSNL